MNRSLIISRLRWPALLLLTGIIALLHQFHIMSWGHAWPLYLILLGVLALAERAAIASDPTVVNSPYAAPYGAAPYGAPVYGAPPANYPPYPAAAPAPPQPENWAPQPPASTGIVPRYSEATPASETRPNTSQEDKRRADFRNEEETR